MGPFQSIISNEEELFSRFGEPSELVRHKTISFLDPHCREFIAKTPLVFLATADAGGACDVSPRGDAPGFVHVVDDHHLVLPERPGNRRFDSLRNILANPKVGLIFVIPGLQETLRINGTAIITKDEALLEKLAVGGKNPWLAIGIRVEECYMHCAKAFIRSQAWNPDSWLEAVERPVPARIIASHVGIRSVTEETVTEALEESYSKRLY